VASKAAATTTGRAAPSKASAHASNSSSRVAAQPGKQAVEQSAPVTSGPPTKSTLVANKSSSRLAGAAGSPAVAASAQHISSDLLEVLLASAPGLLGAQVGMCQKLWSGTDSSNSSLAQCQGMTCRRVHPCAPTRCMMHSAGAAHNWASLDTAQHSQAAHPIQQESSRKSQPVELHLMDPADVESHWRAHVTVSR
jgi:hypothetical protein